MGGSVEPRDEIAHLGDAQLLEDRVALGGRGQLAHVELVVDVHVEHEALGLDGRDRLAGQVEGNRRVAKELAAAGVDHGGALVADHRIRDPGRRSVGPDRLEHPAGHDQHPDPCRTGGGDRRLRPLAQAQVLGDERPVEVAREDLDVEREVVGEDQPEVDSTTYAVTSAICCSES